jgi:2-isopropylmalate synthase
MVTILDTTLREGELHPGVYFTRESRIRIAEALAQVGTPRIELPLIYPQRGGRIEDVKAAIEVIQESYGKTAIIQCRAYIPDVELLQGYEAKGCALYMAPTTLHRRGKLHGIEQQKVIDTFVEALELAKSSGYTYRRAVLEDVSRFNDPEERAIEDTYDFLRKLLEAVKYAGATVVSIPDTSGILPVGHCTSFIKAITELTDQPLACHFHNDYGNALANALQAVTVPQVEEVHVSILGLGARNGITDHYEFVANIEDLLHIPSGEKRDKMRWLYDTFVEATGIPIPWTHPLAHNCFTEKAGTHQSQVVKNAAGYIPRRKLEYDALGEVRFEAGQFVSKRVIEHLFQVAATDLPPTFVPTQDLIQEITEAIAARSAIKQRELSPWEVKEVIRLKAGVEIPIEKLQQVIRGGEYAYILLKLTPQFPAQKLIREVGGWVEVERIDEVYGEADIVIFTRFKDSNGVAVVDKLRNKFKDIIVKTTTMAVE